MSLEAIKNITKAEELAAEKKAAALANSKKMIADAEAAGKAAAAESAAKANADAAAIMADAEERAAKYAEDLRDNTLNKCAAMRAKAETRFESAAAIIVRRVVEG